MRCTKAPTFPFYIRSVTLTEVSFWNCHFDRCQISNMSLWHMLVLESVSSCVRFWICLCDSCQVLNLALWHLSVFELSLWHLSVFELSLWHIMSVFDLSLLVLVFESVDCHSGICQFSNLSLLHMSVFKSVTLTSVRRVFWQYITYSYVSVTSLEVWQLSLNKFFPNELPAIAILSKLPSQWWKVKKEHNKRTNDFILSLL